MWGTKENESRFFRNIEDLLSTRLFDKMQYSDLVTNISVKEIPWLPGDLVCIPLCNLT